MSGDISYDVDVGLGEVPVTLGPLVDSATFLVPQTSVAYNAAGMILAWHFATCSGTFSTIAVVPTTGGGTYDWTNQGAGMYTVEMPATGAAGVLKNDTEGFGWFTGVATGIAPWRGPVLCFRAAALNDADVEGGATRPANVTQWNSTNVAAPDTAGHPKVTVKSGTGTGEILTNAGAVVLRTALKTSQALANFPFLMTDSTNHNPVIGKTVSVTRSIDGGAFASTTVGTATEVANGIYKINLSTSDTAGTTVVYRMTAASCDDLFVTLVFEPAT